jgi:hypothetical protein
MDVTGSSYEGWMTVVPLVVLVLIVTYVVGGPVAFVNMIGYWFTDLFDAVTSWIKYL